MYADEITARATDRKAAAKISHHLELLVSWLYQEGMGERRAANEPEKAPANNPARQARKRILESIKRARQRLVWCEERAEWTSTFVTRAELNLDVDAKKAEATWNEYCFDLTCKEFSGFSEPVTKAEAFATWLNQHRSWNTCVGWWNEQKPSNAEPRKVDDLSRKRMKTRLQSLPRP